MASDDQTPDAASARELPTLSRMEKARREMLDLLDFLCQDSLEASLMELASDERWPVEGEVSVAFIRLQWLIEEVVHD